MIGIIDYDSQSVDILKELFATLKIDVISGHDITELRKCSHLLLPNSSDFKQTMKQLEDWQLHKELLLLKKESFPILGIGMGMNIMMEGCNEEGFIEGLNLIEGLSESMLQDSNFPLPHQSRCKLLVVNDLEEVGKELNLAEMYFSHSLQVDCEIENIVALSQYGMKYPSIIRENNNVGYQFLPEKSGDLGVQAMKSFLKIGGNAYGFGN